MLKGPETMKNILFFLLLVAGPVFAADIDNRVRSLEDRWAQYDASKIEQNSRLAEAIAQIDRLKSEIQALGGGTETQSVQMKQLQDSLDRHYRDLEMRLNAVESQLKLFQDELNRAVAKVAPQVAEEGKQFQRGLTQVQNGDYTGAISSFQQFGKQYPKSPSRADALFWIAECRYSLRDYTQAIKDYQKFVEQFPKSPKSPQAVLKQGDAFLNLQMKEEAKVFWNKVAQDYPRSEEAGIAKAKLASLQKTETAPTTQPTPVTPIPLPSSPPSSDITITPIPPSPAPSPQAPQESGDF